MVYYHLITTSTYEIRYWVAEGLVATLTVRDPIPLIHLTCKLLADEALPFLKKQSKDHTTTRIRAILWSYPYQELDTRTRIEQCIHAHLWPMTLLVYLFSEVSHSSDRSSIPEKARNFYLHLNLGNSILHRKTRSC